MDKYILVYPYNRILFTNKKSQTPNICMHESQKHAKKMKSNIKHKFYLIPFLQNSRKGTATVIEIKPVVVWGRGWKRILTVKGQEGTFLA